jgi:hypothetical protein
VHRGRTPCASSLSFRKGEHPASSDAYGLLISLLKFRVSHVLQLRDHIGSIYVLTIYRFKRDDNVDAST